MKINHFQNRDIKISPIGLGCWSFGNGDYWGSMDQNNVNSIVSRAFELGVNYFDTAEVYNDGDSEFALGIALKEIRNKVLIGSKISPNNANPKIAKKYFEKSLKRLNTDYIDIYMLHWPINHRSLLHYTSNKNDLNYKYDVNDVFDVFENLKSEGKIMNYGVSNFGKLQLNKISKEYTPVVNELPYSILSRAIEYEIIDECNTKGIGIIGYMPLMQGLLTGKYENIENFPKNRARTRHFNSKHNQKSRTTEEGFELETFSLLKKLNQIAKEINIPLHILALKWCQHKINCTLVGARSIFQLEENVSSIKYSMSPNIYSKIMEISEELKNLLGNNPDLYENKNNQRIY